MKGTTLIELMIVFLTSSICLLISLSALYKKLKKQRSLRSTSVQVKMESQTTVNFYERLIPLELFEILGIKAVNNLKFGEERYFTSVVMDVNITNFSQSVNRMNSKEVFTFINRILNCIVPIIYSLEGTVDKFQDAGLIAFFFNKYDEALSGAVSMCEAINNSNPKENHMFSIGLCNGPVMIGVVGHEKRVSILTISESTGLASFLQKIARKYYSRIVVTGSFMEGIPNFTRKFNYRLLGHIYITTSGTPEKIYDVFDGDSVEVRNRKRKTKMMFEKGVEFFAGKEIDDARLCFIEVLKTDKFDSATKEYLYLCDQYAKEEKDKIKIYIEEY